MYGIEQIVHSMKKYLRGDILVKSFQTCGQYSSNATAFFSRAIGMYEDTRMD
jgi:hypothetical protein